MEQTIQSSLSLFELTRLLEEYPAGCEPEFDAIYEELEREFAERRFACNQY